MTKRNVSEPTSDQTQCWNDTMYRLANVRKQAETDKQQSFTALLHHLNPELLSESFYQLKRQSAKGSDGIGWYDYQRHLEENLIDLHTRIQSGRYKPKPARCIHIPKGNGEQRRISIQCVEDKLVQQAVVTLLNQVYEVDFLGFSYGFRPERSQHDALDALTYGISKKKVNWVLDLDIRQFFDTVEHDWLIRMIQHRVRDKRLIRLITRWIKVGRVNEEGQRISASCGLPQGAVISPLLSNIYLHYVFDLWSHQWRKRQARQEVLIVRYADDAVLCFQNQWDAKDYLTALKQRLNQFGLAVHPDKTRLIRFGRFAKQDSKKSRRGKPDTFDFLGFTHYCTVRQDGSFKVGRKTIKARLRKQISTVQRELRKRMHEPVKLTLGWLRTVIMGHMNYYSVPGNGRSIALFKDEVVKRWFKMLRRRSQRSKITWKWFGVWIKEALPKVHIVHPYPEMRFCAKYSK